MSWTRMGLPALAHRSRAAVTPADGLLPTTSARPLPDVSKKEPVITGGRLTAEIRTEDHAAARADRLATARPSSDVHLSMIEDSLTKLGAVDLLTKSNDLLARSEQLSEMLHAARGDANRQHTTVMNLLLAGKATADDVIAQTSRAAALDPESGEAGRVIDKARKVLASQAHAAAKEQGPAIEARLGEIARATALESARLAERLPAGAVSNKTVMRMGPEAYGMWAELGELNRRFLLCHDVAAHLRELRWISTFEATTLPELEARDCEAEPSAIELNREHFARFRKADRLVDALNGMGDATIIEYRDVHPVLRLAHAERVGAEPGLYTAEFARREWEKWVSAVKRGSRASYRKTADGSPIPRSDIY